MVNGSTSGWRRRREESRLRRELRQIMRRARIDGPTSMTEVCERVSTIWEAPIVAAPFDLPAAGPFGLTVRYAPEPDDPGAFYILYQAVATALHQEHVIAHELGHVLAKHPLKTVRDLGEIDPDDSAGALRRTSYTSGIEREAETIATLLLGSAAAQSGVALPSASDRARSVQRALGDRVDWL